MRWIDLPILAVALAAALPAAADVIVVRASGPSATRYVPGRALPGSARIVLQRGDLVVLLDAKGTRTLTGPGSFAADAAPAAAAPSVLAALTQAPTRRSRVGAVRQVPAGEGQRPNIYFVDVAAPGPMCVPDGAPLQLWRANAEVAGTTVITAADGSSASVAWIKGQSIQSWPAALAATDGASFTLGGGAAPVALTIARLAPAPADLPGLGQALALHRCAGQIDVMIAATAPPAPVAAATGR